MDRSFSYTASGAAQQPPVWEEVLAKETNRVGLFFSRLDVREARIVRRIVYRSRHPALQWATAALCRLGNGWLYLLLGVLVLGIEGVAGWRPILAAGLAVAIAFACYRYLKPRLARVRPCDRDPTLPRCAEVLDRYSCPSGHCMTATAVAIPLGLAFAPVVGFLIVGWLLIAWSRLSAAHHYPTDLIVGSLIGAGSALPACLLLL